MKFIHYLEKIMGVDIFAISAFVIFFTIFIVMAVWAFTADRKLITRINSLPLDNQ
ncbi:CcoQ/FixQ family Cbb3-type cytochrome c oxidase assembly chaperone [Chitinophaga parva]|uniref:CcoQ/FixQ family Cbb3-type cytochrome c oxidase assembly chaperone n=1 Tax=Chitinophaga parva TaxID=2169414 RepID=A0A2T7BJ83_9BACT|nr:CcoQ/FixQ family Cbb3-type cytochrome c oxidase assembly chaperone [Chitinophaga parva]PUZ26323.1 CcoQ/FixQ family Cbb3-type cytochrome c oxidase assembly chaperone [Chitinophaga parva]